MKKRLNPHNEIFIYFFIAGIILLALLGNAFPNYFAFLNKPAEVFYSRQASWFDPWDLNLYVSNIKSGQENGLFLENNYTTQKNKPILIYPVYTLAGLIFPKTEPFVLFHLMAGFFGLIFCLSLFLMIRIFVKSLPEACLAFFLIVFGGGAGWLFFPKTTIPDLFMTGFTFTSHFQRPHEAIGIGLYLFLLTFFFFSAKQKKAFSIFVSSIACFFLLFFYPFYFLSYFLIGGSYAIWLLAKNSGKFPIIYLLINGLIVIPSFIAYYHFLNTNSTFSGIISQGLKTPNLLMIFLGYGILTPLLGYQLFFLKKKNPEVYLNFWFIISLILAFLPLGFSRFYLRTLFFPAVILAIFSLKEISKQSKINKNYFLGLLILIVPVSYFFITYKRIAESYSKNPWYYLGKESELFEYLNKNTAAKSGVLTAYLLGNYLPAHTHNKVYFGHLIQTPTAEEKIQKLYFFYGNKFNESEGKKFLENNNIDYIAWGPEEKNISSQFNQSQLKYEFLNPVFENDSLVIFAVNR